MEELQKGTDFSKPSSAKERKVMGESGHKEMKLVEKSSNKNLIVMKGSGSMSKMSPKKGKGSDKAPKLTHQTSEEMSLSEQGAVLKQLASPIKKKKNSNHDSSLELCKEMSQKHDQQPESDSVENIKKKCPSERLRSQKNSTGLSE